jgi:hypothetical protein
MVTDPHTIAARLGIDERLVRRLQARGHLLTLQLDQAQIREHLFLAHKAFVLKDTRATQEASAATPGPRCPKLPSGQVLDPLG